MKYQVRYSYNNTIYTNDSPFAKIKLVEKDNRITLTLLTDKTLILISAKIFLEVKFNLFDKFYSSGYQSWTDSQEQSYFRRTKKMGFLARNKKLESIYHFSAYGDYNFITYHPHYSFSYTYLRHKDNYRLFGSLSERNGYTIFFINKGKLAVEKDIAKLKISSSYTLFDLISFEGKEDVFSSYFSFINEKKKVLNKEKITGFTSWYRHYENLSDRKILEDLHLIKKKKLNFDYFQIDDGYESKIGDWLDVDKEKFKTPLEDIFKSIKKEGYKLGLWLAPFVVAKDSKTALSHPEWLIKNDDNSYLIAGSNWGGAYVLDISKDEVKSHLHKIFSYYIDCGVDLFKLDFLYACSILPKEDKTRGQIMTEAMEFLRLELKDKLILACGVPLFPSFFNVDYCRIGMDVSLIYNDLFYMRFCHRERISTKLTLKNTLARYHLNNRVFLNDPDVILLKETKMSDKQKKRLLDINSCYGSVLFTSDDVNLYTTQDLEIWKHIKERKI